MSEIEKYLLGIDPGVINFSYCLINLGTFKIVKWATIEIGNSKDSYDTIASNLARKLIDADLVKIDDNDNKKELTIIVEAQPKKNIKTLIISGHIQMFFTIEKLNKKNSNIEIKKIVGYHAKNKLKFYEPRNDEQPIDFSHIKNSYPRNKKIAVEQCNRVLKHNNESSWHNFYNNIKKKDDLADSFLMCCAYIKFVLLPKATNNTNNTTTNNTILIKPELEEKYEKILCKGTLKSGKTCNYTAVNDGYCRLHS